MDSVFKLIRPEVGKPLEVGELKLLIRLDLSLLFQGSYTGTVISREVPGGEKNFDFSYTFRHFKVFIRW